MRGRILMRKRLSPPVRELHLLDARDFDLIPSLRNPVFERWEPDGMLIKGESCPNQGNADHRPQAWWCQPAQDVDASTGGGAKWYQWRPELHRRPHT